MPALTPALLIAAVTFALDLTGAAPRPFPMENDLEVIPVNVDGALAARLVNRGDRPVRVNLGDVCASPFSAELDDGAKRSFANGPCGGEGIPLVRTLRPREATLVEPTVRLDGGAGRSVAITYSVGRPSDPTAWWFGTIRSKRIAPVLATDGELAARATRGLTIALRLDGKDVVVDHVVPRGAPPRRYFVGWKGACPSWNTHLLADGGPVTDWPLVQSVCDGPVMPDVRTLFAGQSFAVRGPLPPAARGRLLRARYRVGAADVTDTQPRGEPPMFTGTVESDAIGVRAP